MKLQICFISDTHGDHKEIPIESLGEGDILIHAGDISDVGKESQVRNFLNWFSSIKGYKHKVFIAGNHDFLFERQPNLGNMVLSMYNDITYLQDSSTIIKGIKLYGTPWQPEFYNWAFNLPRNGIQLQHVWSKIPEDTDILITHGPPKMILDKVNASSPDNLGCPLLMDRVLEVKPTIHTFGHIHGGYGERLFHDTTFINCSLLTESYEPKNSPVKLTLDTETKEITYN